MEHEATRVLVQAQLNPEAAAKAFEEYVKIRYPYLETEKKREKDGIVKQLFDEVKRGPLVVTPMRDSGDVRSRLRKKAEPAVAAQPGRTDGIMRKLGRSVPL